MMDCERCSLIEKDENNRHKHDAIAAVRTLYKQSKASVITKSGHPAVRSLTGNKTPPKL